MKGTKDKARFNSCLVWLSIRMSASGGLPKKVDADLHDDYFQALSDIRIERIEWASKHIFATQTWFPMPKDLRDAAMLAPSSVLPALSLNQPQICEFSKQEIEEAKNEVEAIINGGWEYKEAVRMKGCRPVCQL